ncbi:MAG: hypothetical protein J0I07_17075 [Myxococcales bacterium]|nr:hypothetical protein [Myxococcales bacterium]
MESRSEDVPIYSDRTTGQRFPDATSMVNAYLKRFAERAGTELRPLDENGYTQTKKGSASIGVNVLDDHGVLLLIAPVMPVPKVGREALYRKLLELSFLTTADASFAIDAAKPRLRGVRRPARHRRARRRRMGRRAQARVSRLIRRQLP